MVIYYGMGVVPQKPKFNVNFQENDTRIFHRWSIKIWAQIEARDIYYLFPFNLESNDTKHDIVPNGNDPYGQVTIW